MKMILYNLKVAVKEGRGKALLKSVIVILVIFAIVGWQIHKVMMIDTAKIIAKE